jgi:hypothetical protein
MPIINCPECNKQISDKAEICLGCGAPVIKGFRIGNLEIAPNDFPSMMNWQDAINACKALRKGWRLPTKDELNTLYKNKDAIGGFEMHSYYWSSTEFDGTKAWPQAFFDGNQYEYNKSTTFYVRAVRNF